MGSCCSRDGCCGEGFIDIFQSWTGRISVIGAHWLEWVPQRALRLQVKGIEQRLSTGLLPSSLVPLHFYELVHRVLLLLLEAQRCEFYAKIAYDLILLCCRDWRSGWVEI